MAFPQKYLKQSAICIGNSSPFCRCSERGIATISAGSVAKDAVKKLIKKYLKTHRL
jgi:hypothetical protein